MPPLRCCSVFVPLVRSGPRPARDAECVIVRSGRKRPPAAFSSAAFGVAAFTAASIGALNFAAAPAAAGPANKPAEPPNRAAANQTGKDPAKGQLQIIISTDEQRLHLYGNGVELAEVPIATGVADHPTPLGIFSVVQKSRDHRSNIYSNAPMPFMQRITWSGVALHEGVSLGHPASHGCVRMPHDFAVRLWGMTRLDARVVIARSEVRPLDISDPHLFVHKDKSGDSDPPEAPSAGAAPPATAKLLQTAESIEAGQVTDAPGRADRDAAAPNEADTDPPTAADDAESIPLPPAKPAEISHGRSGPIAIFISGKAKRIYVRQDFLPLFDAPVTIEDTGQHLGTHVFTAMDYAGDGSSFRWNVISMPGEAKPIAERRPSYGYRFGKFGLVRPGEPGVQEPLTETPREALARIEIPPDALELISELIVPGSSLIVSDEGLGEETGEGTNFIVVTH
jgi:lipoprotein-anchoring transpeptidase ErfK/SrfK